MDIIKRFLAKLLLAAGASVLQECCSSLKSRSNDTLWKTVHWITDCVWRFSVDSERLRQSHTQNIIGGLEYIVNNFMCFSSLVDLLYEIVL